VAVPSGGDDDQSGRFRPVTGDLGNDAVRRNADRCGKSEFLLELLLQRPGPGADLFRAVRLPTDRGLVDAEGRYFGRPLAQELADLLGGVPVLLEVGPDPNGLRR
jgi:hypothetical protein